MKLTDSKTLAGNTEVVTLSEFRSRPGDIFTQVQMGKEFTVTKNGTAIAVVRSLEPSALELGKAARKLKSVY